VFAESAGEGDGYGECGPRRGDVEGAEEKGVRGGLALVRGVSALADAAALYRAAVEILYPRDWRLPTFA
jgi:hypothetical protein